MVHYNSIIHYDVELELVMGDRPCTGSLAAAYRGGYGGVSRRRGLARLVSASYLALVRDDSYGIECFGVSVLRRLNGECEGWQRDALSASRGGEAMAFASQCALRLPNAESTCTSTSKPMPPNFAVSQRNTMKWEM